MSKYDDLYEFKHKCGRMPVGVSLFKMKDSATTNFCITDVATGAYRNDMMVYNFKYCPYCGEKLSNKDDEE